MYLLCIYEIYILKLIFINVENMFMTAIILIFDTSGNIHASA